MTTTTAPTGTYRKTKTGEWVVMAPVAAIQAGTPNDFVAVVTKSGERRVEVLSRTGKPFMVNGVEHVYGYIHPDSAWLSGRTHSARTARRYGVYGDESHDL